MKKIVSLILIVFFAALSLCACNVKVNVLGYSYYADSEKYSVGDFTYNAEDVKSVEINWVAGNIEVVQSKEETLSVSENGDGLESEERMHHYLRGGTLIIHYCESGYDSDDINEQSKHVTVEVPAGIDLNIDNVSANIEFSCDTFLDEVDIDNVSGNVNIKKLTADRVDFDNVSGVFLADEIVSKEFDANGVSGNIEIGKISSYEINVNSVSGETAIGLAAKADINIDSVSGAVRFTLLADIGIEVDFSSASGILRTDREYIKENNKCIFGSADITAKIDTVSGNLYVK